MAIAYGIGGLISVPQGPVTGFGPPPESFKGQLGQQYFDNSTSPPSQYIYNGLTWEPGGNGEATTSSFGIVELATLTELQTGTAPAGAYVPTANDVATVIQGIVVGAVPAATEIQAGIAEIATQVETDAGVDDTRIVTPLKLANFVGSGGVPGSFTDLTATGTVSFTGATGGIAMTSATASSFGTTGAGIDLTLSSASGRVVVNGEEAAADAVRILSAAGGLDVDVALQMSLVSSQNAADAIVVNASAGGIDITAAGAAGEDIDIVNTAGSVNITAGESGTDAIVLSATIGGIQINAPGAAAGEDIALTATGSSIRLVSTENVTDSIVLSSTNGGIQILTPGAAAGEDIVLTSTGSSIRLTATESATDAINIEATLGGINILASGAAAGEDINLTATGSSVNLSSTENAALAIALNTNGGTSETIRARNQQGTGAASIELLSTAGGVTLTAGLGTADAINLVTSNAAGGIDIDSGTAGFIVDTTGAISLDAAAASNFTATGAFDITIQSTAGSILLNAGEAAADAINIDSTGGFDLDAALQINITSSQAAATAVRVLASDAAGGIDVDAGTGGITIDSTGAVSIDGAAASNFSVSGAGIDLTLASASGSIPITAGEAAVNAIGLQAAAGGIDIDGALQVNIASSQNAVDAIRIVASAGGIDIDAVGAATEDINITNTGGSVVVLATENVADAVTITANGAASGMSLDAGTAGLTIGTGLILAVTDVATAASPYSVLGTDYIINTNSTGGALTITLPATPATGRTLVVYDGVGQAAIGGNVTIDGNGNNIAAAGTSAATKLINTAYESYTLYFNGTIWMGQNIV